MSMHAMFELAPGSPWYAIFWAMLGMVSRLVPADPNVAMESNGF